MIPMENSSVAGRHRFSFPSETRLRPPLHVPRHGTSLPASCAEGALRMGRTKYSKAHPATSRAQPASSLLGCRRSVRFGRSKTMSNHRKIWTAGLALALGLLAGTAAAKDLGPFKVTLRFVPQESVGSSTPTLAAGISEHPIKLSIADGRTVTDP